MRIVNILRATHEDFTNDNPFDILQEDLRAAEHPKDDVSIT